MTPEEREIKRRLRVLEHAEKIGNVRMTCRYPGYCLLNFANPFDEGSGISTLKPE